MKAVVEDQGMRDSDPVRLHGVELAVVEITHVWVVEVSHFGPTVAAAGRHNDPIILSESKCKL